MIDLGLGIGDAIVALGGLVCTFLVVRELWLSCKGCCCFRNISFSPCPYHHKKEYATWEAEEIARVLENLNGPSMGGFDG